MNKDSVEIAEELDMLHPQPMLVGEQVDDFEEELSSVIDEEWVKFNKESYYAS